MFWQSDVVVLNYKVVGQGPKRRYGGRGDIAHRWVLTRKSGGDWAAAECEVLRPPRIPRASLAVPKTTLSFHNSLQVLTELTESGYTRGHGLLQ